MGPLGKMKNYFVFKLRNDVYYSVAEVAKWIDTISTRCYTGKERIEMARHLIDGGTLKEEVCYVQRQNLSYKDVCDFEMGIEWDEMELEEQRRNRELQDSWIKVNAMLEAGANGDAQQAVEYCKWMKANPGWGSAYAG